MSNPESSSNPQTPESIAKELRSWFTERRRYVPLDPPLRGPNTLDFAYEVQDALHTILKADGLGEIAGWKVALTSETMRRITGVNEPVAGAIFSSQVHRDRDTKLSDAKHHHLTLESEVAAIIGSDATIQDGPYDRHSIAGKVESLAPSFEIVDDGSADYSKLDAFTLTAQNAWNGGAVLGTPVTLKELKERGVDLAQMRTVCMVKGKQFGQGKAGDCMEHPLEAVAWMANLLNSRGRMLKRGDIVLTGSTIAPVYPEGEVGFEVEFTVEGLGSVRLTVDE